jgi:uncharacterized protein
MNLQIFENIQLHCLLKQNDVSMLSLFGSSARGEETKASDVDLLVAFKKEKGLLAFVRLERQLGELLGKKVDLVTENALSPHLKALILKEAKVVYAEKE